ncbi:MAG: TlpA disulfide reductase family protein [Desulfitobacteriaceae bacterium]
MPKRIILIVLGIVFIVLFAAVELKSNLPPSVNQATGPQIGLTAPNFTLKDLNGNIVKLSDFRGKPVYLNFWASWCPPCKAEIPEIQQFYQQNKDKVAVLAVNLTFNDKLSDVVKLLKDSNANFPVLLDTNANSSVADAYQVYGIPASFFIDKNGLIRETHVGGMTLVMLQEAIKKAL